LVVKCQATRSREQNRKTARELLAQKLDDLRNGEQSRAALVGEVKRQRSASAAKKSRRKYRALAEEKAAQDGSGSEPTTSSLADETHAKPDDTPSSQGPRD
jgi:peptide chain release factor